MVRDFLHVGSESCSIVGHDWKSFGGRACPIEFPDGADNCRHSSQTAYQCVRCGDIDYGDPGGPGWEECMNCLWRNGLEEALRGLSAKTEGA